MIPEVPWVVNKLLLPTAEKVYDHLYGPPADHAQFAERFNKVGDIIRILFKELYLKP